MILSELRKRAGFHTQREFAEHIGVRRETIAKWEIGILYPQALLLTKIARGLNVLEGDVITAITESKRDRK